MATSLLLTSTAENVEFVGVSHESRLPEDDGWSLACPGSHLKTQPQDIAHLHAHVLTQIRE